MNIEQNTFYENANRDNKVDLAAITKENLLSLFHQYPELPLIKDYKQDKKSDLVDKIEQLKLFKLNQKITDKIIQKAKKIIKGYNGLEVKTTISEDLGMFQFPALNASMGKISLFHESMSGSEQIMTQKPGDILREAATAYRVNPKKQQNTSTTNVAQATPAKSTPVSLKQAKATSQESVALSVVQGAAKASESTLTTETADTETSEGSTRDIATATSSSTTDATTTTAETPKKDNRVIINKNYVQKRSEENPNEKTALNDVDKFKETLNSKLTKHQQAKAERKFKKANTAYEESKQLDLTEKQKLRLEHKANKNYGKASIYDTGHTKEFNSWQANKVNRLKNTLSTFANIAAPALSLLKDKNTERRTAGYYLGYGV